MAGNWWVWWFAKNTSRRPGAFPNRGGSGNIQAHLAALVALAAAILVATVVFTMPPGNM